MKGKKQIIGQKVNQTIDEMNKHILKLDLNSKVWFMSRAPSLPRSGHPMSCAVAVHCEPCFTFDTFYVGCLLIGPGDMFQVKTL